MATREELIKAAAEKRAAVLKCTAKPADRRSAARETSA